MSEETKLFMAHRDYFASNIRALLPKEPATEDATTDSGK